MLTVKEWLNGSRRDAQFRDRLYNFCRLYEVLNNDARASELVNNVALVYALCGYDVRGKNLSYVRRMYGNVARKMTEPLDLNKIKTFSFLRRYCELSDDLYNTAVLSKYDALMDATYFLSSTERLDLAVRLIKVECS